MSKYNRMTESYNNAMHTYRVEKKLKGKELDAILPMLKRSGDQIPKKVPDRLEWYKQHQDRLPLTFYQYHRLNTENPAKPPEGAEESNPLLLVVPHVSEPEVEVEANQEYQACPELKSKDSQNGVDSGDGAEDAVAALLGLSRSYAL